MRLVRAVGICLLSLFGVVGFVEVAPAGAQDLHVLSFDTSTDTVVGATAFLMAAQGTTHQGVIISSLAGTDPANFVSSLDSGSYDFLILDLTNGAPDGDWPGALQRFVGGGGCAHVTVRDPADAAAVAPYLGAAIGPSHDALPISRWNGSAVFDFFQSLPSPLAVADNVLEPNGFLLEPGPSATAAAGFTAGPAAGQAAIVVSNGGRTILHGFLTDDLYPGNADADALEDAYELVQNEIFLMGLSGCGVPAETDLTEVPALDGRGLALFAVALAAAALWLSRRRRLLRR